MSYKTSYKKTIFTGTLILTLSGFLARILGFYNRIFLSNLIGAKELGIYQLIFPVYMLCFSLCCHGFETGISNFTSRFFAKGQKKNAHRLVKLGCLLSFFLSIILMFFLFEGADYLSTFILKEASASPSLKIAALSLPFVSIKACLHGYYIGLNRSAVPAISQIVEQITRVGSIYLLSVTLFILGADARIAAWGMVFGEGVSTFYTILAYFRTYFLENRNSLFHKNAISKKKNTKKRADTHRTEPALFPIKKLFFHFFSFSLPISINHFSLTVISSLETMLIPFMLNIFFQSHTHALETYGTLTGMALPFLFFPATIVNSLSVMLMPAISSAYDRKQHQQMEKTISASLHFCILIGIFSTFAFLIYGTILGETIFHSKEAGEYVHSFSLLCPFMYAAQTTSTFQRNFRIFIRTSCRIQPSASFKYLLYLSHDTFFLLCPKDDSLSCDYCDNLRNSFKKMLGNRCGFSADSCILYSRCQRMPVFFPFYPSAAFKGVCHYTTRAICSHKIRRII